MHELLYRIKLSCVYKYTIYSCMLLLFLKSMHEYYHLYQADIPWVS